MYVHHMRVWFLQRPSAFLEQELQVVVAAMWVLAIRTRSSARAANTLNR